MPTPRLQPMSVPVRTLRVAAQHASAPTNLVTADLPTSRPPAPAVPPVASTPRVAPADEAADRQSQTTQPRVIDPSRPYFLRPLDHIATAPPRPLLVDRIDPEGHTILFGPGGIGKGSLASEWIRRLTLGSHGVLVLDFENHPSEWSRRIGSLGGDKKLVHIATGFAKSFIDLAEDLASEAIAIGTSVVVIDSIVAACIADPSQPETAAAYARALSAFEQPVLSLGHVTKSDDSRYPFGSVFWHNLARITWSMTKDGSGLVLTHRKSNNYALQPRQKVTPTWEDNMLTQVTETSRAEAVADLAMEVLRTAVQGLKARAIADLINEEREESLVPITTNAVTMALRRREKTGVVKCEEGLWRPANAAAGN